MTSNEEITELEKAIAPIRARLHLVDRLMRLRDNGEIEHEGVLVKFPAYGDGALRAILTQAIEHLSMEKF